MSATDDVEALRRRYVVPLMEYAARVDSPDLAAWIIHTADRLDDHLPAWTGMRWEADHYPVDDPPPPGWKNPDWQRRTVEHHYRHPLKLAGLLP